MVSMNTNRRTEIICPIVAKNGTTVRHCNGRTYRYTIGARIGVTTYTVGPEGGALQGYTNTTIKALGYGTEENMIGDQTALVVCDVGGVEKTIPARLVDVYGVDAEPERSGSTRVSETYLCG